MPHHKINFFSQRQTQMEPLILCNVWDAASAKIVELSGAEALATSSASVAWSLGYADGDQLPVNEHLALIKRIRRISTLPITVDIENGYSDKPAEVADLSKGLVDLGVQGINIEDGTGSPVLLAQKVRQIKSAVGDHLFVNARTDTYLRTLVPEQQRLSDTQERINRYQQSGADGIFIPGLFEKADIKQLNCPVPLNLMISELAQVKAFGDTKVKRFSLGPLPFLKCYNWLMTNNGCASKHEENSPLEFETMNNLFTRVS